jgi:hypothetical protein
MTKQVLTFYQDSMNSCCGVGEIGSFNLQEGGINAFGYTPTPSNLQRSGTGLMVAAFINNAANKAAYEKMVKEHKLLYQSPVKRNSNSGNRLFFCVFQWNSRRQRNTNK